MAEFEVVELQQLLRPKNSHADELANVDSNVSMEGKYTILVAILEERSIVSLEVNNILIEYMTWIYEILAYIMDGKCPRHGN